MSFIEGNDAVVELYITNDKNKDESCLNLKKLKLNQSIGELKMKLEILTGQISSSMKITLLNKEHEQIAQLLDNNSFLEQYSLENEMTLYIEGPSLTDDVNSDVKFVLPEEKYKEQRETIKNLKNKLREERLRREEMLNDPNEKKEIISEEDLLINIEVGKRCKLNDSDLRYGTVMFVGETQFASGVWIGVNLDEPYGKNNGSVQNVKYFECENNCGVFVKPGKITIGDYPVRDLLEELDEM